ncbi:sugar transferase [Phormidium sp. CLA17]|uniref:sugar transferase n=1 Tax=Leptolyngbya sp. Cla-17 TaxID=2803751 RepID=UPI001491B470|nr:sugar transferase [Leptolyngbya sp. Cla-17]MBM0742689.1 sugar transferase [Leptolyngbya sp. Cla-17]
MVESNGNPCQVTIVDHACSIHIPPVFTVKKAVEFKQSFQEVCQNNPDLTRIALDFSETKFMDSSGIGALVASRKMAQKTGFNLVLQNVPPQVMSALALADLDKFFVIEQGEPSVFSSGSIAAAKPVDPSSNLVRRSIEGAPGRLMPQRFRNIGKADEQPFITHPSVKSVPKRIIDIVGSIIGLAITGVAIVPIAIAIKLDSPGPLFFGQVRCSQMGKRFKMWKFRSMITDAEAKKHLVQNDAEGAIFKAKNDPRITRVGRILRKTSLDELPQFWNVLKGEMSLVGTRPPTPDEVEKYEIPQWQRLDIKPGMTGEWQVNGRSSVKNFEDIVQLDLKYQENWSLKYDLELIVKTILVIFNKKSGAM